MNSTGKDFQSELHDLLRQSRSGQSAIEVYPAFAPDLVNKPAATLRAQFPVVEDISTEEFIRIGRNVLSINGEIPCTVIVLDEIQLFIGDSAKRSTDVMEIAEATGRQLDSRVLLIGAGQTAGSVPLLQRLRDRFTIPVELSDSDAETVTRHVVLAKKADKSANPLKMRSALMPGR